MGLRLIPGAVDWDAATVTAKIAPAGSKYSYLLRSMLWLTPAQPGALCPLPPRYSPLLLFPPEGPAMMCTALSGPFGLDTEGQTVVAVPLLPGCGDWLVRGDLEPLTDTLTPLEPLAPGADRIGPAMAAAADVGEQQAILGRWILTHNAHRYQPPALLQRCLQTIESREGQIRVAEVAELENTGLRYLHRLMQRKVGLTPKSVCAMVQLRFCLEMMLDGRPRSLLHTAVACGYFDQAHMNLHYRRFLGCNASAVRQLSATAVENLRRLL